MSSVSVILSTYNQPEWLVKALWGFEQQTYKDFEIIIADDGSGSDTKAVIDNLQKKSNLRIKHVWQEDDGFRKTVILNKAIMASEGEYLIFSDGDCIPRNDLVARHIELRKSGCFLSGGYFKLPEDVSQIISKEDIQTQRCFDTDWLIEKGVKNSFKLNKFSKGGLKERMLNTLTPTKATWDGNNASGWRKDIMNVNGFDERMEYGGEDRELGERLMNNGIKAVQARYGLITLHLHHERGYVKPEMIEKNNKIRRETRRNKATRTEFGIE
jgi:glycosyltransferase involved in cell wall biosynthesis